MVKAGVDSSRLEADSVRVRWPGLTVGDHLVLSPQSLNEPGELP